eukprot:869076-Prorocentrum_minimum.AAC.1
METAGKVKVGPPQRPPPPTPLISARTRARKKLYPRTPPPNHVATPSGPPPGPHQTRPTLLYTALKPPPDPI